MTKIVETKSKWNVDFLEGLKRVKTNRVVLLYSSGIDSTATAILLKDRGYEIFPLFIRYGQSNGEVESNLVDKGATHLGLNKVQKVNISNLADLCQGKLMGGEAISDKDAWLPARNTLFLILGGIYAQTVDADAISIGYGIDDNFVFGDNMLVHHQLIGVLMSFSLAREMEVVLPIKNMNKAEVTNIVKSRGMLDMTVSCWNAKWQNDKIIVCNQCANCVERNVNLTMEG
ncbi:MAG: 7-cyano-7-deazaguanine synthase [bacterium]|nr:7-cyano-7-deazaguanine synthase [bacterium]